MRFLCEIIKGESQAEHTERESEILRDGERGREKRWRERVWRWFLSKIVILVFDHRPKSTRDILRYRYWSYLHKVISRRLQILKSLVRRYFYFPTVSGAHDLCSNNSDVFHTKHITIVMITVMNDAYTKTVPQPQYLLVL